MHLTRIYKLFAELYLEFLSFLQIRNIFKKNPSNFILCDLRRTNFLVTSCRLVSSASKHVQGNAIEADFVATDGLSGFLRWLRCGPLAKMHLPSIICRNVLSWMGILANKLTHISGDSIWLSLWRNRDVTA